MRDESGGNLEEGTEGPGVIAPIEVVQGPLVGIEPSNYAGCVPGVEVPLHPVGAALPEPAHLMVLYEPALNVIPSAFPQRLCEEPHIACIQHQDAWKA